MMMPAQDPRNISPSGRKTTGPSGTESVPRTEISVRVVRNFESVLVPSLGMIVTVVPGRKVSVTPSGINRSSEMTTSPETVLFRGITSVSMVEPAHARTGDRSRKKTAIRKNMAKANSEKILIRIGEPYCPRNADAHVEEKHPAAKEGEKNPHNRDGRNRSSHQKGETRSVGQRKIDETV